MPQDRGELVGRDVQVQVDLAARLDGRAGGLQARTRSGGLHDGDRRGLNHCIRAEVVGAHAAEAGPAAAWADRMAFAANHDPEPG